METTKTTSTSNRGSEKAERSEKSEHKAAEAGADIQKAWGEASSALETLYAEASHQLQRTVQERPYVALAAAAGLGFVLGGGLRSVTGRYLLRTTAQLVVPGVLAALKGAEE
jgi:ElaB/YqjD/DUF883 family membrane-anchored ribosome-binding protein